MRRALAWFGGPWQRWVVPALLLAIAPLALGQFAQYIVATWLIFAIAAIGLNIPIGLANIYSFGHGGFMLIGAYGTVLAIAQWGWPAPIAMLASVAVAAVAGALIGSPSLRLAGFSLAIVTFAFAHTLFHVVKAFEYTGGPQGLFVPDLPAGAWLGGRFYYYLVLVLFFAALAAAHSLATSKTGRALRTLGRSEIVAQSLGIALLRYKITAVVLSSVYGATAGSLMALVTGYVAPDTYAPELSVNVFAAVMIGGMGTLLGPVLGAFFVVLIPEFTQSIRGLSLVIYAVLFTAVAVIYPGGLIAAAQALRSRGSRATPPSEPRR